MQPVDGGLQITKLVFRERDGDVVEVGARLLPVYAVDCRKCGGRAAGLTRWQTYKPEGLACGKKNGGSWRRVYRVVVVVVVVVVVIIVVVRHGCF